MKNTLFLLAIVLTMFGASTIAANPPGVQSLQQYTAVRAIDDHVVISPESFGPIVIPMSSVLANDDAVVEISSLRQPRFGTVEIDGDDLVYTPPVGIGEDYVDFFRYEVWNPRVNRQGPVALRMATVFVIHESRMLFADDAENGLPVGWESSGLVASAAAALQGGLGFEVPLGLPTTAVASQLLAASWPPGQNDQNNDGTMMVTTIDGCEATGLPMGHFRLATIRGAADEEIVRVVVRYETDGSRRLQLQTRNASDVWLESDWYVMPDEKIELGVHWWPESMPLEVDAGVAMWVNGRRVVTLYGAEVVAFVDHTSQLGAVAETGDLAGFFAFDDLRIFRWRISDMLAYDDLLSRDVGNRLAEER